MRLLLRLSAILSAAAIAASSCSGVRECRAPQLNLPHSIGGVRDTATIADVEWWKLYGDSALVYIIDRTLDHNRDFLAAAARVEQMRELYGIDRANLLPTLSGQVYANNETNDYKNESPLRDPEYGLKVTLAWEADLWGGLSWARKRGAADFQASVEEERAMRITLIAEAASAYYNLVALDRQLTIVRRTLFTREENLKKAKLRFEGGLTPETVYQQAQVEYATTAALIPALESAIALQQNAIALLMGRYPSEVIERNAAALMAPLPESIPAGLPSALLQRRPDLRRNEARLRSALASVGVAYSDRFPKLRFNLTGGWENNSLKGFFESPFSYVLGSVAGPIIDFKRNKRKHRAAIAAYEQARLAYEQSVLEAFHEVDNAIVSYRSLRETTARRRELLDAAEKYAQLASAQYNMGVINYIDVLDAQRRYFDAEVSHTLAVRDEYLALITLYRALGGGWER